MKRFVLLAGMALVLAGCNTVDTAGPGWPPVPGSITYGGQPHTKLTKSPVGSTFTHEFRDQFGNLWQETYAIRPNRDLKIIDRYEIDDPLPN